VNCWFRVVTNDRWVSRESARHRPTGVDVGGLARRRVESGMNKFCTAIKFGAAGALVLLTTTARADGVDALRRFVADVQGARASFTQTVTTSDNAKKKSSTGQFEFQRPNRFRFTYAKPYAQVIVGDGAQIWLHDPDLQQASVRPMDRALGATPAALLAGQSIEKDFELKGEPSVDGVDWVRATPRVKDGAAFQSMRLGFKGPALSSVEIVDSFSQRTVMSFGPMTLNPSFAADAFKFTPPPGTDVLRP
jgi:outer membrane lipoprotein carrier protein